MGEIYLAWAVGVSLGFYLGSRYPFNFDVFGLFYFFILTPFLSLLLLLFYLLLVLKRKQSFPGQFPSRLKWLLVLVSMLCFLILGYIVCVVSTHRKASDLLSWFRAGCELPDGNEVFENKALSLEGRISDHPRFKNGNLYFILDVQRVITSMKMKSDENSYESTKLRSMELQSMNPQSTLKLIEVQGTAKVKVKNCYPGFVERDDYIRVRVEMERDYFTCLPSRIERIEEVGIGGRIFALRRRVYRYLKTIYYRNLDFESASIAEALFLGNTLSISTRIKSDFRKSGVFHILAISGLHISILVYFLGAFRKTNFSWFTFGVMILFLFMYNFLVGEKASVERATIMGIFVILGRWLGREYSMKIVLYLTYTFMLLSNPFFWYDSGFWLSFVSMAAIIFLNPLLKKIIQIWLPGPGTRIVRSSWMALVISNVSVQISILPLLFHFFGDVSTVSILSNLMVIPVFYAVLFLLFASSILGLLHYFFGAVLIKPAWLLIKYILEVVRFLGERKISVISIDCFKAKYIILYYTGLIMCLAFVSCFTRSYDRKNKIRERWIEKQEGLKSQNQNWKI